MQNTQKVYTMLGNENLWETAKTCHDVLVQESIPHSVCGGVAVCLHGYQRNTVDLDLIIRSEDSVAVKQLLEQTGLVWNADSKEFRTKNGIAVQFLISGERAGSGAEVMLPDPAGDQNVETIEGLPVIRLSKLIEVKLACGLGNIRRMHKDLADVVELIAIRNLDGSFTRFLHKSVRKTFRELVKNARGES